MDFSQHFLDRLFNEVPDEVYIYRRDGTYHYINRAAERFLGRKRTEVVERHWKQLGFPAQVMIPFDLEREMVLNSGVAMFSEVIGPATGHRIECMMSPIASEEGAAEAVLVIARNLTIRQRPAV